jgi:methylenetetrahydrofolate reductase (NADPH)
VKVSDCILKKVFTTIVEFLPPVDSSLEKLKNDVYSIQDYTDFISLTSKPGSADSMMTAANLMVDKSIKMNFISHLTLRGVGRSEEMAYSLCTTAAMFGVDNLLVMRGDSFDAHKSDYNYASQLVKKISDMNKGINPYRKKRVKPVDFCIGVVANQYRQDEKEELKALKAKIDAGAKYVILQMCFEVDSYKLFCERAFDYLGRRVPIFPSVPVPDKSTIRFVEKLGSVDEICVPEHVKKRIEGVTNDREEGIKIAREILNELRYDIGVPGVDIISRGDLNLALRVLAGEEKGKEYLKKPSQSGK